MNVNFFEQRTISWERKTNSVVMIDQEKLPEVLAFIECKTLDQLVEAIQTMKIRGAPAIGVAGAMGVALAVLNYTLVAKSTDLWSEVAKDCERLKLARPTAINLSWGVKLALDHLRQNVDKGLRGSALREAMISFVVELADQDVATNKELSRFGAQLFQSGDRVLTHCK